MKVRFIVETRGAIHSKCRGLILSSNPLEFGAAGICDKCVANHKWVDEDQAEIENNLAARLMTAKMILR